MSSVENLKLFSKIQYFLPQYFVIKNENNIISVEAAKVLQVFNCGLGALVKRLLD
jgi:hypothetical protein